MHKSLIYILIVAFACGTLCPNRVLANELVLPAPGTMVHLSPSVDTPILKGIKVHPENPFKFDFVLSQGDATSNLNVTSNKLVKYFLAALTTPEKDMWVNLSPYEKDRIVPEHFGTTEMGRDLLAQDYLLKQITASLVYPEGEVGQAFWKKVYALSPNKNIPVNTFNKVWIVPNKAVVYENAKAGSAYVVESSLKVMTEQDYLADTKNKSTSTNNQVVRDIVIPQLTKEVNEGSNFAQLRQVYNSLILATWYKKKIKDSILSQVYADKNKVAGVNIEDPQEKQKIYQRYLEAFKKGAYNYIKEEQDPVTHQIIPKKYFSGGISATNFSNQAMTVTTDPSNIQKGMNGDNLKIVSVSIDRAQIVPIVPIASVNVNEGVTNKWLGNHLDQIDMFQAFEILNEEHPEFKKLEEQENKILVIGGTVEEVNFLIRRYPKSSITVVSLNESDLRGLQAFESNMGVGKINGLFLGDVRDLTAREIPDDSFDIVFSHGIDSSTFLSEVDATKVLQGIASQEMRMLKAGGLLYHPYIGDKNALKQYYSQQSEAGSLKELKSGKEYPEFFVKSMQGSTQLSKQIFDRAQASKKLVVTNRAKEILREVFDIGPGVWVKIRDLRKGEIAVQRGLSGSEHEGDYIGDGISEALNILNGKVDLEKRSYSRNDLDELTYAVTSHYALPFAMRFAVDDKIDPEIGLSEEHIYLKGMNPENLLQVALIPNRSQAYYWARRYLSLIEDLGIKFRPNSNGKVFSDSVKEIMKEIEFGKKTAYGRPIKNSDYINSKLSALFEKYEAPSQQVVNFISSGAMISERNMNVADNAQASSEGKMFGSVEYQAMKNEKDISVSVKDGQLILEGKEGVYKMPFFDSKDVQIGKRIGQRDENSNMGYRKIVFKNSVEFLGYMPELGSLTALESFLKTLSIVHTNPQAEAALPRIYGAYYNDRNEIELIVDKFDLPHPDSNYLTKDASVEVLDNTSQILSDGVLASIVLNGLNLSKVFEVDYTFIEANGHLRFSFPVRTIQWMEEVGRGKIFRVEKEYPSLDFDAILDVQYMIKEGYLREVISYKAIFASFVRSAFSRLIAFDQSLPKIYLMSGYALNDLVSNLRFRFLRRMINEYGFKAVIKIQNQLHLNDPRLERIILERIHQQSNNLRWIFEVETDLGEFIFKTDRDLPWDKRVRLALKMKLKDFQLKTNTGFDFKSTYESLYQDFVKESGISNQSMSSNLNGAKISRRGIIAGAVGLGLARVLPKASAQPVNIESVRIINPKTSFGYSIFEWDAMKEEENLRISLKAADALAQIYLMKDPRSKLSDFLEVAKNAASDEDRNTMRWVFHVLDKRGDSWTDKINWDNKADVDAQFKRVYDDGSNELRKSANIALGKYWSPELLKAVLAKDKAMNVDTNQDLGGIDFNADKMKLELQNSGDSIKFQMDAAELKQLQDASGFTPVIVNIQPMTDLKLFLGLSQK